MRNIHPPALRLRLDADVVAWFKSRTISNEGYQTRINRARREYVQGGQAELGDPELSLHRKSSILARAHEDSAVYKFSVHKPGISPGLGCDD